MAPDGTRQPFIMPDGRRLGAFLEEDGRRAGADAGRRRGKNNKKADQRWERNFRATNGSVLATPPANEADAIELEAISKVGRERRRRWLNDKILRDMAGAMSAADMDTLFKPPPFGGPATRPSVLAAAALPQNVSIWDLFRNIDMEKQHRVLEKWTEHVAAQRGAHAPGGASVSPALKALQSWANTSRKARDALRRSSLDVVHSLEHRLLQLLLPPTDGGGGGAPLPASAAFSSGSTASEAVAASLLPPVEPRASSPAVAEPAGSSCAATANDSLSAVGGAVPAALMQAPAAPVSELQLQLLDGFHRLLVHGIAQYHGLSSFSRNGTAADASPTSAVDGDAATAQLGSPRITVVRRSSQEPLHSPGEEVITVSDILLVMDQHPQGGLTAAMLAIPGTPVSEF